MFKVINPSLITTEELKKISGWDRPSRIEKWCDDQGIRYFPGRYGPTTTIDLMNAAKGLVTTPEDNKGDSEIQF